MKEVKFKIIASQNKGDSSQITEVLILFIVTLCWIMLSRYHWKRRRLYAMASKIPGPPCYPIIGSAYLFKGSTENILNTVFTLCANYKNPVKVWLGHRLFIGTSSPEHLEIIFNHPKAIGKDDLYKFVFPVVGHGLFTASVEKWKKNRKIIAPAFNQKILNDFVTVFAEQSVILTNILQSHTNKLLDIKHFADNFTLNVVAETSMGVQLNEQSKNSEIGEWLGRICHLAFQRMFQIWYHPDIIFYNLPIGRELRQQTAKFSAFTESVVVEKRAAYYKQKQWARECPEAETDDSKKMKSFLDLLIELTEDGDKFTNEQLKDEVNTFFAAGADTSATALGFACIMLGMHPEYQHKMYEEAMDVLGPDRPVEYTDLPNLKFIERFVLESNRLFPIGPLVVRAHEDDIKIDNYVLPAGSSSVIVILHTHRCAKYWPNPLKFDPDRFLPENVAKRHPYAYVAFTGGLRMCIGKKYGIMLLKTVMAHLIRKFTFSTPYKNVEDIRLKQDMLLQPVEGYKVKLELREL